MQFKSFSDYYPYHLKKHSNPTCRRLHFLGTCGVIALLLIFFFTGNLMILTFLPLIGYGLALVGHIAFEKNKITIFSHPFYGIMGDFKMFWDILIGRIKAF